MKKMFLYGFCMVLTYISSIAGMSSYPYISGDTFRTIANHIFDERHPNFVPESVKDREIIFVKTDYIEDFFTNYHPRIPNNYILITHNADHSIPGPCARYLDDPKLIVWFGQNLKNFKHPKIHPLPIGLANRYWKHGSVEMMQKALKSKPESSKKSISKKLLYMNFAIGTNPRMRQKVYDLFCSKNYCFVTKPKDFGIYLEEMAHYCFVLCPEGNGIDCHRTWEALYMGCIPVVQSSSLDPLFENLPVLIVKNWEDITQEFLIDAYKQISSTSYTMNSIYADYWFKKIKSYQIKG